MHDIVDRSFIRPIALLLPAAAALILGAVYLAAGDGEPSTSASGMDGRTSRSESSPGPNENVARWKSPGAPADKARWQEGHLSGTVVDGTGAPAPGARVRLKGEDGGEQEVRADDEGRFSFTAHAPNRFLISSSTAEAASEVLGPLALARGQRVEGLRLQLLPAASVTGTVFATGSRAPIPGAIVRSATAQTITDHAGRFRLTPLAPTRTWIEARAAGFETRLEWLQVDGAREHGGLRLHLRETQRLRGRVTRLGTPVAGAQVWAERADLTSQAEVAGPVTSSDEGTFELEVPSGHFVLFASARVADAAHTPGAHVQGPRVVVVEGVALPEIQLELGEALEAHGAVTRQGLPVSMASLLLLDARTQRAVAHAVSGAGGAFSFTSVPIGRFLVQVSTEAGASQHGPFDLTGTGDAPWLIELADGGASIRGRVVPARPGLVVRARASDWAGSFAAETSTDGEGAFALDGLTDGARFVVEVVDSDGASSARAQVTAPAEIVLRLEPGAIIGHAADGEGRAVTDFVVRVAPESGGAPIVQPVLHPRGEFRIPVPPGRYRVEASASGGGETESPAHVEVQAGRDSAQTRLVLALSEALEGIVVDSRTGDPIASAEITVHRRRDSQTFQFERARVVATDAQGRFSLGTAGRQTRLRFRAQGFRDAWLLARDLAQRPEGRVALTPLPENARRQPDGPQQYEGVGMSLRFDQALGGIYVDTVFDGGPAQAAGLLRNDQLLAVEGQPVEGRTVQQVVPLILGPSGTVVRLTLRRAGETFVIGVRRRTIDL